jgi:uncharacterized Zn finger protein
MTTKEFPIEYICPHCKKGKTMADHIAEASISCKCSECGNVYVCDLKTKRVLKAKARASPNMPRSPATLKTPLRKFNTS